MNKKVELKDIENGQLKKKLLINIRKDTEKNGNLKLKKHITKCSIK